MLDVRIRKPELIRSAPARLVYALLERPKFSGPSGLQLCGPQDFHAFAAACACRRFARQLCRAVVTVVVYHHYAEPAGIVLLRQRSHRPRNGFRLVARGHNGRYPRPLCGYLWLRNVIVKCLELPKRSAPKSEHHPDEKGENGQNQSEPGHIPFCRETRSRRYFSSGTR